MQKTNTREFEMTLCLTVESFSVQDEQWQIICILHTGTTRLAFFYDDLKA